MPSNWNPKYRETKRRLREKRIRDGLCIDCGEPNNGSRTCSTCQDKRTEHQRKVRAARADSGKCPACGDVLSPGKNRCERCYQRKRKANGIDAACETDGCKGVKAYNRSLCQECYGEAQSCPVYCGECNVCGNAFTSRRPYQKYCSEKCLFTAGYYGNDVTIEMRECPECGGMFQTYNKSKRVYCSTVCGRKSSKRNMKHIRRLRLADGKIEVVHKQVLFQRDNGRCQICGRLLNLERQHPHPLSATIDHVIPLSLGGEHSYRNTQLACLRCNSYKGAGSIDGGEQLRLFG